MVTDASEHFADEVAMNRRQLAVTLASVGCSMSPMAADVFCRNQKRDGDHQSLGLSEVVQSRRFEVMDAPNGKTRHRPSPRRHCERAK